MTSPTSHDAIPGAPHPGAALIVGAGPRLGGSMARALGADGRPIGLIGRSADTLVALASTLESAGIDTACATAEVADAASLTAAIDAVAASLGPIDVAVHNVSVWRDGGATGMSAADLLADVAAGVASVLTMTNRLVPEMIARGRGTVLATGSAAADFPTAGAPSLGVQKSALRTLLRGLAAELAPQGVHCATITINGVLGTPGFDPDAIAAVYRELVGETDRPRETWRSVVTFDGA